MGFRQFSIAAACLAALTAPAFSADKTITVLHVSENPAQKAVWNKIADDYNASHPGVKVQFKYLENEAFKAKLPTMLQAADSRPELFYSWAGGVMQAQDKAGFLKDITADVASVDSTLASTAVDAFKVDGKQVGVPFEVGEVVFYYNKKLFEKAGVKAEDIKTWDDFLGAVKKLKAAGITPLVVGAGEKWPMHFYYSYLVMRIGGEHALADAKAGKDGGFKNATFVEAGKRLRELGALEPSSPAIWQPSMRNPPACSATARRRWISWASGCSACRRRTRPPARAWPRRISASCPSPSFQAARARRPTRSAASTAGW